MAVISVEVPDYVKKTIWTRKISFYALYNKMEQENWIDLELDAPIEMGDFYNMLKQEL